MNHARRSLLALAVAGALAMGTASADIPNNTIKLGVLSDFSGIYKDLGGEGSVVATKLAVQDSGIEKKGIKVEIIQADHQNKPDVGSAIARRWFESEGVDAVVDVPTSSVALAVSDVAKADNKVMLNSGAGTSDLTGKACSPNTVHFTYDTWMLAHGTGTAITKAGGNSWYFITADYAFGHALQRDTTEAVEAAGGKVVGSVNVPITTTDFSSYLLQAQASKAKVIGLANAGSNTTDSIKQASEFGIVKGGQQLAGLLVFLTDIHALGLKSAEGLTLTTSFYWDMNDQTRAFAKRFAPLDKGIHPTMVHAGVYAVVLHYLKAVEALHDVKDGRKVVEEMKKLPTDDPLFGKGSIRVDGRGIHPAYLMQVKTPAESKYPWDYLKLVATIPADQAFRPLKDGGCSLVK